MPNVNLGDEAPLLDTVPPELEDAAPAPVSNQATANRAKAILCELEGFRDAVTEVSGRRLMKRESD
jgi:hypothetical protein